MLAIDSVNDRMDAYKKYVNDTLGLSSGDEQNIIDGNPQGKNALAVAGLASLAAISAVNYSAVTGESATLSQIRAGLVSESAGYLSRLDIISAIANVQAIALDATERLSQYAAQFGAVYFFNQYFDYSVLNRSLISATIRNLNSRIFTAASEKIYVTEKDYGIIPLSAKLYKSVTINTVQFLAESNDLHGDMLYLIPCGTEIKYY
jgi:hypothetical protein